MVKISDPMVLYRVDRFFSAFPSVVTLPSGDVLLAFRRAPDHRWLLKDAAPADFNLVDHVHPRSHIALRRFGPDLCPRGDAWAMAQHPEAGDQDGNLFLTQSGRLIQYSFLWCLVAGDVAPRLKGIFPVSVTNDEGVARYLPWGTYVRTSDDEGHNWSDYIRLPIDPDHDPSDRPDESLSGDVRGRMIELPDGRLMIARYQPAIRGHKVQATRLVVSSDGGKSWRVSPVMVKMPDDIALQEPALAQWPAGKISLFHRTAGHDDRLVTAQSHDSGETFAEPETVPIQGHPYDPLVLPDGRLFLVYGYRHKPMGVRARIVKPGQAIDDAAEIIIRDDSPSRDTGYPSATLLNDGRILIAYYIADKKGIRGIEANLLELD